MNLKESDWIVYLDADAAVAEWNLPLDVIADRTRLWAHDVREIKSFHNYEIYILFVFLTFRITRTTMLTASLLLKMLANS